MKKFMLYRTLGSIDRDIKKHELVEVVIGENIYNVTDELIQAATDDMKGMEQFAVGYTFAAYAPIHFEDDELRTNRYSYGMDGIACPAYGEKNVLITYAIAEVEESRG